MSDKPELPPGWKWDPEGVGADQYEASAGPTEETMQRVIQEVVDEAWAIYRKRWAEALAEGEKAGIRKGLEMARDLTCPRCADLEHNPLGTGAYADRHVFAGDVLGYCVATEIRRALKGETP